MTTRNRNLGVPQMPQGGFPSISGTITLPRTLVRRQPFLNNDIEAVRGPGWLQTNQTQDWPKAGTALKIPKLVWLQWPVNQSQDNSALLQSLETACNAAKHQFRYHLELFVESGSLGAGQQWWRGADQITTSGQTPPETDSFGTNLLNLIVTSPAPDAAPYLIGEEGDYSRSRFWYPSYNSWGFLVGYDQSIYPGRMPPQHLDPWDIWGPSGSAWMQWYTPPVTDQTVTYYITYYNINNGQYTYEPFLPSDTRIPFDYITLNGVVTTTPDAPYPGDNAMEIETKGNYVQRGSDPSTMMDAFHHAKPLIEAAEPVHPKILQKVYINTDMVDPKKDYSDWYSAFDQSLAEMGGTSVVRGGNITLSDVQSGWLVQEIKDFYKIE